MKDFSKYNYTKIVSLMENLFIKHDGQVLNKLKNELNNLFDKTTCKEVVYTNNTDKLFFGMRVYPVIKPDDAVEILNNNEMISYYSYYLEVDSKLLDPMLGLTGRELTAVLLHEVGHIVYDTAPTDEVKKQLDMYFADSGECLDQKNCIEYKQLIAYAMKDSVMKCASMFTKIGNTEMMADSFVAGCGFGPELESGFNKIKSNAFALNQQIDDRLIVFSWVLRLYKEIGFKRLAAIRTLNKAKSLSASQLEKREITSAINSLNRMPEKLSESAIDNVKARFSKKFAIFKAKGVRAIQDDVYILNLKLRTIESEDDAAYIIRTANQDISILEDYMTEPELTEETRKSVYDTLQELYSIRQKASKDSSIRDRYSSMIQVIYPKV